MPVHSFFAVELTSAAPTIRTLDEAWLLDQLESGRMSLPNHRHEGRVLLTASTKQLEQALAGRVGEAFGDPQTLERLR